MIHLQCVGPALSWTKIILIKGTHPGLWIPFVDDLGHAKILGGGIAGCLGTGPALAKDVT